MIVEGGVVRVVQGPRENLNRPAIDPLFRSAAAYGPRVIGVIDRHDGRWNRRLDGCECKGRQGDRPGPGERAVFGNAKEQSASLYRRMAGLATRSRHPLPARQFEDRAANTGANSKILRDFLLRVNTDESPDPLHPLQSHEESPEPNEANGNA